MRNLSSSVFFATSSSRSSCSLSEWAYVLTRILIDPPGLLASMSCSAEYGVADDEMIESMRP